MFTTAQLRVFLRALANINPYTFADDVAEFFDTDEQTNQQTAEEILTSTIDKLTADKLTSFALRLVLTGHKPTPDAKEIDFLAEAERAFASPQPKTMPSKKGTKTTAKPLPKSAAKTATKPKTKKPAKLAKAA